jgi:RNA polymerase sigma-70 factor (ECF subfamily)
MGEATDADLIRDVLAWDEEAFRHLYRRHTPAMYAAALRLLARRRSDADDAIQEAWLRAVRGLAGFRGESALRTWLVGIAIRCALEAGRRSAPAPVLDIDRLVITPALPPIDLEAAVAALADGYRQVFILHDLYGYTHAEIAALVGIDEGTSKSQLSRARAALRRWFARDPQECSHGR